MSSSQANAFIERMTRPTAMTRDYAVTTLSYEPSSVRRDVIQWLLSQARQGDLRAALSISQVAPEEGRTSLAHLANRSFDWAEAWLACEPEAPDLSFLSHMEIPTSRWASDGLKHVARYSTQRDARSFLSRTFDAYPSNPLAADAFLLLASADEPSLPKLPFHPGKLIHLTLSTSPVPVPCTQVARSAGLSYLHMDADKRRRQAQAFLADHRMRNLMPAMTWKGGPRPWEVSSSQVIAVRVHGLMRLARQPNPPAFAWDVLQRHGDLRHAAWLTHRNGDRFHELRARLLDTAPEDEGCPHLGW